MVHNLVLAAERNRTLGTFEEAREEIVVDVGDEILDAAEYLAAHL